jgi:hypothetical protein
MAISYKEVNALPDRMITMGGLGIQDLVGIFFGKEFMPRERGFRVEISSQMSLVIGS